MNQFLVACFVHVGNIACGCFRNHAKSTCLNYNYSQNYDLRNSLMQIKIFFRLCYCARAFTPYILSFNFFFVPLYIFGHIRL